VTEGRKDKDKTCKDSFSASK